MAAGYVFLAVDSDDAFGRWLAVFLVALTLIIAASWYRHDRRARITGADRYEQPN